MTARSLTPPRNPGIKRRRCSSPPGAAPEGPRTAGTPSAVAMEAPTSEPPSSTIDHLGFPHIIDAILEYAGVRGLVALRAASREYRDRADERLFAHVRVRRPARFQAELCSPAAPFERLPYLPAEQLLSSLDSTSLPPAGEDDDADSAAIRARTPSGIVSIRPSESRFLSLPPVQEGARSHLRQLSHATVVDYESGHPIFPVTPGPRLVARAECFPNSRVVRRVDAHESRGYPGLHRDSLGMRKGGDLVEYYNITSGAAHNADMSAPPALTVNLLPAGYDRHILYLSYDPNHTGLLDHEVHGISPRRAGEIVLVLPPPAAVVPVGALLSPFGVLAPLLKAAAFVLKAGGKLTLVGWDARHAALLGPPQGVHIPSYRFAEGFSRALTWHLRRVWVDPGVGPILPIDLEGERECLSRLSILRWEEWKASLGEGDRLLAEPRLTASC